MDFATVGAGCFWGVEAAFRKIPGVLDVTAGYAGGSAENPTYKQVCTGTTGHAEVVHIAFDPEKVTFESLLDTFWRIHDPTTLNRQGPDRGSQYRSIILYRSESQRGQAQASRDAENASGRHGAAIVTEIAPFTSFFPAEDYHQRYLEKQGRLHC